jgi:hypothetical protein
LYGGAPKVKRKKEFCNESVKKHAIKNWSLFLSLCHQICVMSLINVCVELAKVTLSVEPEVAGTEEQKF